MTEFTLKDRVEQFIQLRDKIEEIKARHKEELVKYETAKEKFEEFFLGELQKSGADNMKFETGTVYKTVQASATVADGSAFREWIIANDAFEFADIRANKTKVRELVDDGNTPPPGVNYTTRITLGARRPGKS